MPPTEFRPRSSWRASLVSGRRSSGGREWSWRGRGIFGCSPRFPPPRRPASRLRRSPTCSNPCLRTCCRACRAPQRRALEIALLLDGPPGPAPDPRAVAFAFLTAVRALARGGPVVVAIDDIQWLDGPSASTVEFAIRRLRDEPVVFLLALRAGKGRHRSGSTARSPRAGFGGLPIGPLSLGALHRLLGERLDLVTSRPKLRRIRELSGGNPLFALELGRAVQRGAIRLEPGEALPGTLAAAVRDRLMLLPQETRTALLAASALSQPTLALVRAAVGGDPEPRLAPALEAHVIELEGDRIRFSHPLLASGVYSEAGSAERRALHRRLAELLPDLEERARHLALGAEGPDEEVAADARAGGRASTRPRCLRVRGRAGRARPAADARGHGGKRDTGAPSRPRSMPGRPAMASEPESSSARLESPPSPGPGAESSSTGSARCRSTRETAAKRSSYTARLAPNAGDDVALRARAEEGLASALFLLRSDLSAAADHARAAVALAETSGEPGYGDRCSQPARPR